MSRLVCFDTRHVTPPLIKITTLPSPRTASLALSRQPGRLYRPGLHGRGRDQAGVCRTTRSARALPWPRRLGRRFPALSVSAASCLLAPKASRRENPPQFTRPSSLTGFQRGISSSKAAVNVRVPCTFDQTKARSTSQQGREVSGVGKEVETGWKRDGSWLIVAEEIFG